MAKNNKKIATLEPVLGLMSVMLLVVLCLMAAGRHYYQQNSGGQAELAHLGDYVAGITGGVGLLGMVVAVLLQTRELGLQRTELEETQAILADQGDSLKAQTDAMEATSLAMREQVELLKEQTNALVNQAQQRLSEMLMPEWELNESAKLKLRNFGLRKARVRLTGIFDTVRNVMRSEGCEGIGNLVEKLMRDGGVNVDVRWPLAEICTGVILEEGAAVPMLVIAPSTPGDRPGPNSLREVAYLTLRLEVSATSAVARSRVLDVPLSSLCHLWEETVS